MRLYMVKIREEMMNMQRLHFGPRDDLQFSVHADVPSAAKRAAKQQMVDKGYEVLSASVSKDFTVTINVRAPQRESSSPLLYRRNPQPLRVTGAGRLR